MKFEEVVKERKSIRKYLSKNTSRSDLDKILKLTNRAPSAGNLQAYKIIIIKNRKLIAEISENTGGIVRNFKNNPPCLVVFCADPEESSYYKKRGRDLYCIQDATIACAYAQLSAVSLGISTCWVGSFDEGYIVDILNLRGLNPVAILSLGYADESPKTTERKDVKKLVRVVR